MNDPLNTAFAEFLSTVPVTRLKQNLMKVFTTFVKHHYRTDFPDFTDDLLADFDHLLDLLYNIEEAIEWASAGQSIPQ